jgi:tetratricopeptide (TPR) repeat protein
VDVPLQHFEGSIENRRLTFDPVQADLSARAARALAAGDAVAAEGLYRQAVAAHPTDAARHADLGGCLFFQARYGDARAAYRRALELDSRSADALYGLGCVGYKEGGYQEAQGYLVRALEIREADGATHRVLALVYDQLREPAKARTHYERAAVLDPAIAAETHVRNRLAETRSTEGLPVEYVSGTFCPSGPDKFLLREKWKNVGDRPIRTLYMNITVYNKDGKKVYGATDYPIYSVPDSEPGVLPGQTHVPGAHEGFIIPFGVGHPDQPHEVTGKYTRATEKGIK